MVKVFVGNGAFKSLVIKMFQRQGYFVGWEDREIDICDTVCVIGGGDINPRLYGEKPLPSTYYDDRTDEYDLNLVELFKDKSKIGICRGGQLLNVLSGGGMWQHVDGHESNHDGFDIDTGERVRLSSIHHQMMKPSIEGLVVTTSKTSSFKVGDSEYEGRNTYLGETTNQYPLDIEGVYYENTNSLCFQPHPEVGPPECEEYFFSLIHKYLEV